MARHCDIALQWNSAPLRGVRQRPDRPVHRRHREQLAEAGRGSCRSCNRPAWALLGNALESSSGTPSFTIASVVAGSAQICLSEGAFASHSRKKVSIHPVPRKPTCAQWANASACVPIDNAGNGMH